MKLKGFLLAVEDVERSRRFYAELFGLTTVTDNDGNLILSDGLVLQDKAIWESFVGRDVKNENNATELYFEEADLDAFVRKLKHLYPETVFVNRPMVHAWGQKVVRFYDPDGHLIEVGTPM